MLNIGMVAKVQSIWVTGKIMKEMLHQLGKIMLRQLSAKDGRNNTNDWDI